MNVQSGSDRSAVTPGSISCYLLRLREGEQSAAKGIWNHYFPRLKSLAERALRGRRQQIADAGDAVQDAFVSFCQRIEAGKFQEATRREDLWNLLATITTRKVHRQLKRERAKKRGGGQTITLGDSDVVDPRPISKTDLGDLSTVQLDIECEALFQLLDPELVTFALLRMMEYEVKEIAKQMDCSVSKVERKLRLVRACWQQELEADH